MAMAGELIYAFRIMRLPLLDAGGAAIGRIDDIVVVPGRSGEAPRVTGFVATSQRRRIFVNANRVSSLEPFPLYTPDPPTENKGVRLRGPRIRYKKQ